jgi:hypothetical protein
MPTFPCAGVSIAAVVTAQESIASSRSVEVTALLSERQSRVRGNNIGMFLFQWFISKLNQL